MSLLIFSSGCARELSALSRVPLLPPDTAAGFRFHYRISEPSERPGLQPEIFPMAVSNETGLFQTKPPGLAEQVFVPVNADNLCDEHIMARILNHITHHALQIHRRFRHKRRGNLIRRNRRETALRKFIHIPSGAYAAEIHLFRNRLMGGSELTMPVQAMVIRFCFPSAAQETSTTGTGFSIVPGFIVTFLTTLSVRVSRES